MNLAQVFLFAAEFLAYGSFTWAALRFFKLNSNGPVDWRILFIKYVGIVFILWNLVAVCMSEVKISPFYWMGMFFVILGFLVFWGAIWANRTARLQFAFSGVNSQHLVNSGIYKYVRHPFYLSYSLAWLGSPLALQNWILIIPFIVMGYTYIVAAKIEENYFLNSSLREQYQNYMNHSGMFLPKMSRRKP